jgi:hypothetical protein
MVRRLLSLLLVPVALAAGPHEHFDLLASFDAPEKTGENGAVAVTFRVLDPDVKLNETPAPRLKLDLTQDVLIDHQAPPPRRIPTYDPLTATYVDLAEPVRFPVSISPTAPAGLQRVEAEVVFFYCSVREAWCRRGTADIEVEVTVP